MMTLAVDSLLSRISAALRDLPGAESLYLFGSAADPLRKDDYSDLDLEIITADFDLSSPAWPWILSRVGEITLVCPIRLSADEAVYCLTFAGESLYHKVDIGLSTSLHIENIAGKMANKACLWQQPPIGAPLYIPSGSALVTEPGTPLHFLIEEMLSAVRYLKARKRGRHLACWRFLSAKFNALLRCYLWKPGDPQFPAALLNTWDFTILDHELSEPDRLLLLEILSCRSPLAMDIALRDLTLRITGLICPSYATDATPAARLIREYLAFIESELQEPSRPGSRVLTV